MTHCHHFLAADSGRRLPEKLSARPWSQLGPRGREGRVTSTDGSEGGKNPRSLKRCVGQTRDWAVAWPFVCYLIAAAEASPELSCAIRPVLPSELWCCGGVECHQKHTRARAGSQLRVDDEPRSGSKVSEMHYLRTDRRTTQSSRAITPKFCPTLPLLGEHD